MEKKMKTNKLLPLSTALLFTLNTQAEEDKAQLQDTVVTASRYEQSQNDIIPSVSVIDREDILNLQANSILDLLVLQQGIDVARSGGNGTQTSVFMRGTNSNHALVLIDGVRVSSSFTGSFAWENLPVSQIERIEIVRGTRVSYYGSDAIGGVINIITRKQDNLYVRYTGGSFDSHDFDIGYGDSTDKGNYSIVVGSQKTDGYSATNSNNSFSYNPDNDGYENLSLNLNGSLNVSTGKINFNYLETKSDIEFDSFFNVGNSDASQRIVKIAWQGQLFNNWKSELALSHNKNSLETKVFSNGFNSDRNTFDFLLNKQIDTNHIGLGISYRKENSELQNKLVSLLNYTDSRNNLALFANWQGVFSNNTLSLSGRYDDNSIYGSDTSADASWAYAFSDATRLNFSVGSAFHAPNLNELFSPQYQSLIFSPELGQFVSFFSFEGNPDLKPEESLNYELGLKTKFTDNQDFSFNLFYYKIDNLVDFQGSTFKPVNVNESTIKGVEAVYNYSFNNLNFNINATHQDANNDETDTPLLRRPDNKINISIDKFYNKFSLGSSIRYASKNYDFGTELDGYTVIDLRAAYKLNDNWRIALKVENATDKEYQIINGFNTSPAASYITIEWNQ
jgi:vitamin B12 transporter